MGTWDSGPLDNDTAADWCRELHDAPAAERTAMVRTALTVVIGHDADTYLDDDFAVEAIAAAAVIAAQLPDGPRLDSPYAPDFIHAGGGLDVPDGLPSLALLALDRIDGANSALPGLWEDGYPTVLERRRPIRAALERAAGSSPG
ncbi:DUF4259 domain-containing protein [Dactylosporangium siamense]|uniref:DUF4259 domain-containing protein n=1 Tax=Dactylosporangium siamense TaxID=685454 RepID=A0A919PH43_9ACTN|nr:DUF4259 domain-containing protein [Dactylosporangium siamense]GIG44092.1 hypothetical protein Dsi01nite_021330 [Dactylosporangium siamense]